MREAAAWRSCRLQYTIGRPGIPGVDDWLGEVVPKDAQGGGREQPAAPFDRRKPDPAHGENPQDLAMAEEERGAALCANATDDTVRARAHGVERLAARAAVAGEAPTGALNLDLGSSSAFLGAVDPLHQIIVGLDASMRHRKLGRAAGALQGTRENAIDAQRS